MDRCLTFAGGAGGHGAAEPGPAPFLALARRLLGVQRDADRAIQGGADDAALLRDVRGRVALARRRALWAPDVAEGDLVGKDLHEAREHVRAGAHVARLLLHPEDLL